ncbi:RNA methyltransferase [Domibacillus sp. DTU_2020_1001157_1_SI_ALB_TIR_016]|nr:MULTISPECIES: RNA methyltransferase [unclassified Domibacillus]MCI2253366.1 RNA methyltransferase [Domibacillus sp. PGB-M46]WNS79967.1 RNA methyltransferase [Domibacillus sp. DTU_2020_1001157_1_SI_ALB_TIR_016]
MKQRIIERRINVNEFIYTVNYSEEDEELAEMELRAFFGSSASGPVVKSSVDLDVNRSPFIREKVEVLLEADSVADIVQKAGSIDIGSETFKAIFVKTNDLPPEKKVEYQERLEIERAIGWEIIGEADLKNPDHLFGLVACGGRWYLGRYEKNKRVWMKHIQKPREYSTALSARDARVMANIAVPEPEGIRAVDPCCGIGTVLVEALSMGMDIEGRDINPLVVGGSRENLAYFGLEGCVTLGPIEEVEEHYDVAIIDMPYNLYTHATPDELQSILTHARRIADRLVVVSIDPIEEMVEKAGFAIQDRCIARKSTFSRRILSCS